MSFILKALKKLENEKASREMGKVEINSAILAPDRRSLSSSRNSPKRLVIALLIVAVSGTSLYFMKKAPSPVVQAPAKEAQHEPAPRAVPVAATPVHGEKPAPASPAPSPAVKAQEEPSRLMRAHREKSPEPSSPGESGSDSHHGDEALTGSATSPLTVNGIALQDDPGQSMAVVNGQIVKRGMTVGGAQVERIFLNRVRFRGNGGLFEVHLAK
jgi:hypothetical protein